jgi:hypothetical protein
MHAPAHGSLRERLESIAFSQDGLVIGILLIMFSPFIVAAFCVWPAVCAMYADGNPAYRDLLRIKAELAQLPGVTGVIARDDGCDEYNTYVTATVAGKGEIEFYNLDLTAVNDNGVVTITHIGDCVVTPMCTNCPLTAFHRDLRFNSVREVVDNYNLVRTRLWESGHCQ